MKRLIITAVSVLIIVFIIVYLFAFIPLKQWSFMTADDIHSAQFSELYTEAREKLGVFSGMFILNHISITWLKQSDTIFVESVDFSFIHKASSKVFDACTVSFQTDVVILSYVRDEPKGICNQLAFPFVDTETDTISENSLIAFLNYSALCINDWVLTNIAMLNINSGSYRTIISGNPNGTVSFVYTDIRGFSIQ